MIFGIGISILYGFMSLEISITINPGLAFVLYKLVYILIIAVAGAMAIIISRKYANRLVN